MNEVRPYSDLTAIDSAIQSERWNLKLQALADTLMHHIREEEQDERHEPKGVYIDFKQLK